MPEKREACRTGRVYYTHGEAQADSLDPVLHRAMIPTMKTTNIRPIRMSDEEVDDAIAKAVAYEFGRDLSAVVRLALKKLRVPKKAQ